MEKEEILEKSREENKNFDVYEKEVMREGGNAAAVVAGLLATIFFVIQILLGEGMNYPLYAVVFSIPATGFTVKALRLKRRHEIITCVCYIIATLSFSAAAVFQLIEQSKIL